MNHVNLEHGLVACKACYMSVARLLANEKKLLASCKVLRHMLTKGCLVLLCRDTLATNLQEVTRLMYWYRICMYSSTFCNCK